MTRIAMVSDLHMKLPEIPMCDILLIAGDTTQGHDLLLDSKWLFNEFKEWLDRIPAKHVVGIAGNHDLIYEKARHLVPNDLPWHYLEHSTVTVEGFKIFGMPWSLPIWGAFQYYDKDLAKKYAQIPDDTNIIISHCPPFGVGDLSFNFYENCGSKSLMSRILEIKPKLTVFGHIHEGRGIYVRQNLLFVNAAQYDGSVFLVDIE